MRTPLEKIADVCYARPRQRARRHSSRRAMKRLGLRLNRNRRAELVAQMLSGTARFIGTGAIATRTRWVVTYGGSEFILVFDERIREIVTVFTRDKGEV